VDAPISYTEARLALDSIERRRHQILTEIDVPPWYWVALAGGWVVLGVLADYGPGWATIVGTVLFGAAHAAIAPRILSGRRGSPRLSINRDIVSRRIPLLVIGFLIVLIAATVALGLLFHADGARHPATLAGVVVAAIVLCGGPALMASIRRRAERA
jgi:hypothetical protein